MSITTLGFSVLSVPVAHPGISLPAGRCAGGKRGLFFFDFFSSFAPSLCSRRRINTVLTSLSGLPTEQTRLEVRRTWDGAERRREGRTVSTLPVEQKPLYFLPWNKSAFRLQTESRAWVLINIEHTLFMFPLMGYFLHVSLAPQVLMGRRVQREDGSCATPGFNLLACECAWKSVRAHVCMHPTRSLRLRAVLYRQKRFAQPRSNKTGLWIYFWFVCLGNDSLRSHWRIKTLLGMNSSLFLPIILLSCELAFFFFFFKQKKRTSAD